MLAVFATAAALAQGAIGYHMLEGIWAIVVYPLVNFAFASVVLFVVRHRGRPDESQLRAPRLQLIIVLAFVALHFAALASQFPDPALANNPLTQAARYVIRPFAGVFSNLAVGALPVAALLLLSRRLSDYGLARFDLRSLLIIMALYLPLLLTSVQGTLTTAAIYFVVAALPEELLYRALLQRRLRAVMRDPLVAVVIAALIFGFMHLPINSATHGSIAWSAVYCIGLNAFGGALFGYIYLRTQSLAVVAIIHWWAAVASGASG